MKYNIQLRFLGILSFILQALVATASQDNCNSAMGMEDGRIHDDQINATSWLYFDKRDNRYYRPHFARLNYNKPSGGWCSAGVSKYADEYIEIDLRENARVTGIAIQGRHNGQEWVESFSLEYKRLTGTKYRTYQEDGKIKIFKGNTDINSTVRHVFSRPIILHKIRVIPLGDQFTIYCMRLEVYGCIWNQAKDHLLSYSAPLGGIHKSISLQDNMYDGFVPKNPTALLTDGLGKLTDGIIGSELLIRASHFSYSTPWVGYTKEAVILFSFRSERNFYSLTLYVINKNRSIRLFNKLDVEISNDGENFKHIRDFKANKEQTSFRGPLAINVPLNGETGSFLRCTFKLNRVLMLLSEVQFDTADALENDVRLLRSSVPPMDGLLKTKDDAELGKRDRYQKNRNANVYSGARGKNASQRLSFPIILTIALVGTVFLVAVIAILVRFFRLRMNSTCKQTKVENPKHRTEPSGSLELFEEGTSLQTSASRYHDV